MNHRTLAPLIAALLLPLLALASACGSSPADPTPTPEPSATAVASPTSAPTATPTPDLSLLLRDGGIAIIEEAYHRLLDEYIEPLEPAPLLNAAWDGIAGEAATQGLAMPARPSFAGGRGEAFGAFTAAWVPLASGASDATALRFAAIRAMAGSLQDCHTYFLNPVASNTLNDTRTGRGSVGIGIDIAGVPPLVSEVITGGPAARAGVLAGDRITQVDGRDTAGLGPASVFDLVNGPESTSVRVVFARPSDGTSLDLTIPRERVIPPNIDPRIVAGNIGYVRVRNFVDEGIAAGLSDALSELTADGATSWIIDVRNNPGGFLDNDAASLFVADGVITRNRGRGGVVEEDRATGKVLPERLPAVLLVNNRTGSVAEIFAAALKEYGAAHLIGTATNGCVGYTSVRPFGDGSSMAVTTHVHVGPISGTPLSGAGVAPDQYVDRTPADIAAARDPQLDAAIAFLSAP